MKTFQQSSRHCCIITHSYIKMVRFMIIRNHSFVIHLIFTKEQKRNLICNVILIYETNIKDNQYRHLKRDEFSNRYPSTINKSKWTRIRRRLTFENRNNFLSFLSYYSSCTSSPNVTHRVHSTLKPFF